MSASCFGTVATSTSSRLVIVWYIQVCQVSRTTLRKWNNLNFLVQNNDLTGKSYAQAIEVLTFNFLDASPHFFFLYSLAAYILALLFLGFKRPALRILTFLIWNAICCSSSARSPSNPRIHSRTLRTATRSGQYQITLDRRLKLINLIELIREILRNNDTNDMELLISKLVSKTTRPVFPDMNSPLLNTGLQLFEFYQSHNIKDDKFWHSMTIIIKEMLETHSAYLKPLLEFYLVYSFLLFF